MPPIALGQSERIRPPVLMPPLRRCRAIEAVARGVLAQWVARGDAGEMAASGTEATWRSAFEWPGRGVPIAALTRQFDLGDAAGAHWLRADPAHVRADMATARMLACGELGLSVGETASIERDLKPLFGDAGFLFEAPTPQRWYLRAASDAALPEGADPDEVLGDDLKLHLPAGASGRRWRMLFNETQVLLHNHAVNTARSARGAVSVNSLWFWGAGSLPDWVRGRHRSVMTKDPALIALARLAGLHTAALEPVQLAELANDDLLIDLSTLRDVSLETDWLAPIDAALRRGRVGRVELVFHSGERHAIRAAHRWRVWRRVRGLDT